MPNVDENQLQQIRKKVDELVERLRSDPSFREVATQNPDHVLAASGLPAEVIADFQYALSKPTDVMPPNKCVATCIKGSTECTYSYVV